MTSENPETQPDTNSPATQFRYCPRCGKEGPDISSNRSLRCRHCDFLLFFNSATAAGAFIFHRDQLILCVRSKEPGKGLLDVAGGFLEFDESAEEGLRREILEELNLEATGFHYLASAPNDYLYAGVLYKTTDLFFTCEVPDISRIRPADDVADFLVVAAEALDPARLAFPSTRNAFRALLEKRWESGRGKEASRGIV